jgi:hypothetical protein
MPSILKTIGTALLLATSSLALVARSPQHLDLRELGLPERRADPSLTGYLGAFFLGNDPDVYFYLVRSLFSCHGSPSFMFWNSRMQHFRIRSRTNIIL